MKKIYKILLIVLGLIIVVLGGLYLAFNEKKPTGIVSKDADVLALKMTTALGKSVWDSTNVVKWTFKGVHTYVWNKKDEQVLVKWDEYEVYLNLKDWQKGKAFENGVAVTDKKMDIFRGRAYEFFCNDSFWLMAPFKVFDEGVSRQIVDTPEGQNLLVSYTSGGVTPGDSYLWQIGEDGKPVSYKMWVKIIPIGGVKATWESWIETQKGLFLAQNHKLGSLSLEMENIKTGQSLTAVGESETLFDKIK